MYVCFAAQSSTMPRRTKTSRTLIPDSDDEGDNTRPSIRTQAKVDLLPEQHTYRDQDGRLRHEYALLEVPASPTKPTKPPLRLGPDTPPASFDAGLFDGADTFGPDPEDEAPVYDLLPKERRRARASVWQPHSC
jgi:hypothetical protein